MYSGVGAGVGAYVFVEKRITSTLGCELTPSVKPPNTTTVLSPFNSSMCAACAYDRLSTSVGLLATSSAPVSLRRNTSSAFVPMAREGRSRSAPPRVCPPITNTNGNATTNAECERRTLSANDTVSTRSANTCSIDDNAPGVAVASPMPPITNTELRLVDVTATHAYLAVCNSNNVSWAHEQIEKTQTNSHFHFDYLNLIVDCQNFNVFIDKVWIGTTTTSNNNSFLSTFDDTKTKKM